MVLILLCLVLAVVVNSTRDFAGLRKRHEYKYSLKKPFFYLQDNKTVPFYDYYGGAIVGDHFVKLSASVSGIKGSVWSKKKNILKEWMMEIKMVVSGRGDVGGDGFAFFYTKEQGVPLSLQVQSSSNVDPWGLMLGHTHGGPDRWNGLAVVFDTFDEVKQIRNMPYVFGVMNDNQKDFLVHQVQDDPHLHQIGGCYYSYRNLNQPLHIRILYINKKLEVYLDRSNNGHNYDMCFTSNDIELPDDYYFGLSASAGTFPDDHDLISMDLYEVYGMHAAPVGKEEPHINENDEKLFEQIHKKVEDIREADERQHLFHEGLSNTPEQARYNDLKEVQMKILENIEFLGKKVDTISTTGEKVSTSNDVGTGFEKLIKDVDLKLVDVINDLKLVKKELDEVKRELSRTREEQSGLKSSISESISLLKSSQDRLQPPDAHIRYNPNNEPKQEQSFQIFSGSIWIYVSIFVVAQVALFYGYRAILNSKNDQFKKFI